MSNAAPRNNFGNQALEHLSGKKHRVVCIVVGKDVFSLKNVLKLFDLLGSDGQLYKQRVQGEQFPLSPVEAVGQFTLDKGDELEIAGLVVSSPLPSLGDKDVSVQKPLKVTIRNIQSYPFARLRGSD